MGVDEEGVVFGERFPRFSCDLSVGGILKHAHQCRVCKDDTARQGFGVFVVLYGTCREDKVDVDLLADLAW